MEDGSLEKIIEVAVGVGLAFSSVVAGALMAKFVRGYSARRHIKNALMESYRRGDLKTRPNIFNCYKLAFETPLPDQETANMVLRYMMSR